MSCVAWLGSVSLFAFTLYRLRQAALQPTGDANTKNGMISSRTPIHEVSCKKMTTYLVIVYSGLVAVASFASLVAYGYDKHQAKVNGQRIPEMTLHLIALMGGWPGAIAGQRIFRHKTQKLSFLIGFWIVTAMHLGLVGGVGYLLMR